MVWFAVPLALIMTANVVLFVGSASIVRQTAASTAAISCGPSRVRICPCTDAALSPGLGRVSKYENMTVIF